VHNSLARLYSRKATKLSLPLPASIPTLVTTTPVLTSFSLSLSHFQRFSHVIQPLFFVISIFVAALTALISPYLRGGLEESCTLESQWANLYHDNNGIALKFIEQSFKCCGFKRTTDRPWPRPNQTEPNPCTALYGWQDTCQGIWGESQRAIARDLLAVLLASWICHVSNL
jgi:hypothetical protein